MKNKMAAARGTCDRSLPADLVQNICTTWAIPDLKDYQQCALASIVYEKQDSLICVPTGSGKSLCFEALCMVADHHDDSVTGQGFVLVISPLVSLLEKQVTRLSNLGISAINLYSKIEFLRDVPSEGQTQTSASGTTQDEIKNLKSGKYRYIFGNPESFLDNKVVWEILKQPIYKERVICLVFDEVHTAVAWGLFTDQKPAFRSYFAQVGDLRAHFSTAPMLCLTATATKTTQLKIKELLALKNPWVFQLPPDRPNIRLCINRISTGPECLDWLVEQLHEDPKNCVKTIIYCRTFKKCSEVYLYFLYSLGKQSAELDCRLFDMVHSKTSNEVKQHVLDSLLDRQAFPRIVIATKVIGLGLDVECQLVVHYGPPSTIDDYLQQIGRAGRDGSQTHAIMLYSGKHLRNVDASILELVKNTDNQCLRSLCLKEFNNSQPAVIKDKHMCCNVCAESCECDHCFDGKNSYEIYAEKVHQKVGDDKEIFQRNVKDEDLAMLKVELLQLAEKLNRSARSASVYVEPEVTHGLGPAAIEKILEEAPFVFCPDDLIDNCNIAHYSTVVEIVDIFSEIFGDMDTDVIVDEDVLM